MDIYVGNLPFNLDEQTVIDAFSEYGSVARFKMITDRETGRPRGFGFITMDDDAQAEAAINAMDGQEIGGRAVRVNAAQQKSGGEGQEEQRQQNTLNGDHGTDFSQQPGTKTVAKHRDEEILRWTTKMR